MFGKWDSQVLKTDKWRQDFSQKHRQSRQSLCDVRECGLCVLGYIETLRHCGLVNLGWEPRGGVTKIELQRIGCYVILKIIEFHWDSGRLRYFDLDAHAS